MVMMMIYKQGVLRRSYWGCMRSSRPAFPLLWWNGDYDDDGLGMMMMMDWGWGWYRWWWMGWGWGPPEVSFGRRSRGGFCPHWSTHPHTTGQLLVNPWWYNWSTHQQTMLVPLVNYWSLVNPGWYNWSANPYSVVTGHWSTYSTHCAPLQILDYQMHQCNGQDCIPKQRKCI